uniref:Uncharacterized protein n=1 Tax=Glossina palpalis gambiensis TaxID=67801 RepID=A0A1B0BIF0_9MUSC
MLLSLLFYDGKGSTTLALPRMYRISSMMQTLKVMTGEDIKFFASWKSHKNYVVALSITEAESMSTSNAAKENIYIKRLLNKLECNIKGPVIIKDDNQSAMTITTDSVMHESGKHIEIKFHRDLLQ